MKRCFLPAVVFTSALLVPIGAAAQGTVANESSGSMDGAKVVMTKLYPPVYPPLARAAHIAAIVVINVTVRPDGAVASTELVSGHPMLSVAALESAQKSQFECRGCAGEPAAYSLTYSFKIVGECRFGPNCEELEPHTTQVTEQPGRVEISAGPACCCDPAAAITKTRSAKCLYLWKCGHRDMVD